MNPPPDYVNHRIKIWEELKNKYQNFVASQPQIDIKITLPDGKTLSGKAWKTTPIEIAQGIRYVCITLILVFKKIILS